MGTGRAGGSAPGIQMQNLPFDEYSLGDTIAPEKGVLGRWPLGIIGAYWNGIQPFSGALHLLLVLFFIF